MLNGGTVADEVNAPGSYSWLTDRHVSHLLGRGLTPETIEAAGLWSASAEQVAELLGFNPHSAGIVIPYRHPLTGKVVLNRVRPDIPPVIGGKPAKYLSPKGTSNRLYFPPDCAKWLRDPSVPIGLVEGEFKTLWAYQEKLRYVGLTGVYGFLGKNERGETRPISDLDLIPWPDRDVTITFDSDVATNEKVRAAREASARELYRRGVRGVHKIDLPELDGQTTGLDGFLKAKGIEAFYDLDAEGIPSPYPQVKIWTLAELRAATLERPAPIVPGWGIRQAGKVIFTGAGGRGKSTLLLQLACDLASGRPLLGHPQLTVHGGPHRVLLYMAEDPLPEVRFRLLRQIEELGCGSEVEERIHILDFGDRKPQILTDEWALQVLADRIRQHGATIAMLDPLVSLHDRDENSNPQMRAVLDAVSPIGEETGCVFSLAHHEPKNPENNGAASRGASAIRDWCRTMLRLTAKGSDEDGTQRFQLDLDKANYGGTVWSLALERRQDSYLFTPIAEGTVTPQNVWDLIGAEGGWLEDIKALLTERFGVSDVTARRAIKKAEKLHVVATEPRTNPETGRKKSYLVRGGAE